jgi:hypothetical protein
MSGYSDRYRDQLQAEWLDRWVPRDDPHLAEALAKSPDDLREQYRFTLARARDAEAQLERHRSLFGAIGAALRDT